MHITECVSMINANDSHALKCLSDNEDTKPDKDARPVPTLPFEDSMNHFFKQPLSQ